SARPGRRLDRGTRVGLFGARVQPGHLQSAQGATRPENSEEKDRHTGELPGDQDPALSSLAREMDRPSVSAKETRSFSLRREKGVPRCASDEGETNHGKRLENRTWTSDSTGKS